VSLKGNRRRALAALGILVVLALLVVVFHDAALETVAPPLARSAGYDLSFGSLHLGADEFVATKLDVANAHGEPIATVDRVRIGFDARDLLPGGKTLFGLRSVDIERPHLTLVHHRDGSYNIALPHGNASTKSTPLAPLDATIHLADGSASIVDEGRLYRESRLLGVEHLNVDGRFQPHAPSRYVVHLALVEDGRAYPVNGHGYLDDARGIESNVVRAAEIPIGPLVDYALNTAAVHITRGSLVDLDARYFGLPDKTGAIVRHLGVAGRLENFTLQLGFLAKPLRAGTGDVFAYDDGLTIPRLSGTVAAVPVTVAGGIYDFAKPSFRLGVAGSGALARLVTLSDAAKKLPVNGNVRFGLLVVGDATAPLTLARFGSPRLVYQKFPLDRVRGLVAIYGIDTTVLDATVAYAGATAVARGNIEAKKHTDIDMVANLSAPTKTLPYADTLLPGMTLGAVAVARGRDAKLETAGTIDGDSTTQALHGLFALAPNGTGRAGPLTLEGPRGESLVVDATIDRPRNQIAGILDARDLRISNTRVKSLAGLALPVLPPFELALDAALGGSVGGGSAIAGTARVHDATLRGVPLGDLALSATGAIGKRASETHLAARGSYRGRLDDLARLGGGAVPAHGDVELALGAIANGPNAVAEIHDTRLDRVVLDGVALNGLDATVGVRGKSFHVYEARAALGPGSVVASGSFGDGGTVAIATSPLDLSKLGRTLPVHRGTVSAVASVGGTAAAPTLDAGVVASNVRYRQYDAAGSASLGYRNAKLTIASGLFDVAGAVADLDGTVGGLAPGAIHPTLALDARARAVDLASVARIAKAPLKYPTGSLDARVHVSGTASAPRVAGDVAIPEGSLNGLDYRDAAVSFAGTAANLSARGGTVTVGTSRIGFAADVAGSRQRVKLDAPRLDLADFNDYFDAADTLAGRGSASLALTHDPDHLATRAAVTLAGVQVKRIAVGSARAYVNTAGRTITTNALVGDARGTIGLTGGVTLPATQLQRDTIHRTNVALTAKLRNLDLQRWLPILNVHAPVAGLVNADARVRGIYPALDVAANARLDGGRVGRIPVQTANLAATASRGRLMISSATFDIPNLTTTLVGYAGLRPTDPVALTLRSSTTDIGALAKTVTAQTYDVSGTLATALSVTGTPKRPKLGATVEAGTVRYMKYTVPRVHAEVAVANLASNYQRGRLDLRNTEIDLTQGRITASGNAPFDTTGLGPPAAPVSLALGIERLDLGQFGAFLPKNTKLAGLLAGDVGLGGTVANPSTSGSLDLTKLSYLGPQEVQRITNGAATIAFTGRTVALRRAHVDAGGGSIDATASATVGDLHDPAKSTTYVANAVFNHPLLQLPNLYRGRLDGNLGVSKASFAAPPLLSGAVTASSARIPYTALLPPAATGTPGPPPPPVNLALGVTAGKDVRVQSGPVDIGAQGHIDVTGTVASPKASGEFVADGGTVDFYRNFTLQSGTVAFEPSNGVIPNVSAVATTNIASPDTDITLDVKGLATSLNVGLSSTPAYDRAQILGLLVGLNNYGAVAGVPASQGGPAPTAGSLASNVATGQISTLFQRNLLEPLSANLGAATGFKSLSVNYGLGTGVSLGARRQIVKNVDAVFAETFGYPPRESYGLAANNKNGTSALQLTFFQQPGSNQFDVAPQALMSTNDTVTAAEPQRGQNGYSFSLQRKF